MRKFICGLRPLLSFRRPSLIEFVLVIAIIAVILALIIPGAQWASEGDIPLPVRVFVFDAERGIPIAKARVTLVHAPPLLKASPLEEDLKQYDVTKNDRPTIETTGSDGTATIEYRFRTSANNQRPKPFAHLRWVWVDIEALGYSAVVMPVRYESHSTSDLKKQAEVVITVGLRNTK